MTDWRDTLSTREKAKIEALEKAELQRRLELKRDKDYIYMSEGLKTALKRFRKERPVLVDAFFKNFGFFTPAKLKSSQEFLSRIKDANIRQFFLRYLNFAARFGAVWKLKRRSGLVDNVTVPWGSKFLGRIANGKLLPTVPYSPDDAAIHLFEKPDLKALPQLERAIHEGRCAYVELEDTDGSSLLSQLEAFAYNQGVISFVMHRAEQPYILCFVGENVKPSAWRGAGKIVQELRKEYFRRVDAGRPPNMEKFQRAMKLRDSSSTPKQAALDLTGDIKDFEKNKVFLSRAVKRTKQ